MPGDAMRRSGSGKALASFVPVDRRVARGWPSGLALRRAQVKERMWLGLAFSSSLQVGGEST